MSSPADEEQPGSKQQRGDSDSEGGLRSPSPPQQPAGPRVHPPASRQQQEAFDELSGETRAGPGPSQQPAGAAGSSTLLPSADPGSGSPPAAGRAPSGSSPLHGASAEGAAAEPVRRKLLQAQAPQQLEGQAGSTQGSVLHIEGKQDEQKCTGQQAPVNAGLTRHGSGQNLKQAQLPSATAPAGPLPHHNGLTSPPLNGSGARHAASNGVLVSSAVKVQVTHMLHT